RGGARLRGAGAAPPLPLASPAGGVVLASLGAQIDRLKSLAPMVRLDEPDPEHQMRVAPRRLRSTLRSFGKIIDSSGAERLGGELKWLGDVLGEARDAEVTAEHLVTNLRRMPVEQVIGPVQARVQGHFAKPQATAREAVLAAP